MVNAGYIHGYNIGESVIFSTYAIIGISGGVLIVIVMGLVLAVFIVKRKKTGKQDQTANEGKCIKILLCSFAI